MAQKAAKGRKTRSAGRFGCRYGRKVRNLVADIEENMRQAHKCPKCGRMAVWREGTGIWSCTKCKYTYTGGTYVPQTPSGKTMARTIRKAVEGAK
jgi:large subunit ribosomal protein L37Ae